MNMGNNHDLLPLFLLYVKICYLPFPQLFKLFHGFTVVVLKKKKEETILNCADELQTQSLLTTNKISAMDSSTSFMLAIIVQAPIIFSTQEQIHSD